MSYDLQLTPTEELALLFRSGHGLIVAETHEERRLVKAVQDAAAGTSRRCYAWSAVRGLVDVTGDDAASGGSPTTAGPRETSKILGAVAQLEIVADRWVAVFTDAHRHFDDPSSLRALREIGESGGRRGCSVCLVSPTIDLPEELARLATPFLFPLPDATLRERQVRTVYRRLSKDNPHIQHELRADDLARIVEAMMGLTEAEADRILCQAILRDGKLAAHDIEFIRETKRALFTSKGRLEIVPVSDDLSKLGGLDRLKTWLRQRKSASTEKGRAFGLTPAKGVLLLGVPGGGKSLTAKLTAGEWTRPLLRLDMGALYNRFVGNSEANLRDALRQADAMAPCVLWIDEIEKAFASESGGADSADGGVSQRLFGTMLTWMSDRKSDVFIVATANQVHRLPPELMRKGRFDEIFFVDLPPAAARRQILEIHLAKRGRDPAKFDLDLLAQRSEGFTGAEIEQAIVDGLFAAFHAGHELATVHVLGELARTRPMAVTMAERIDSLRAWAMERCVMAHAG